MLIQLCKHIPIVRANRANCFNCYYISYFYSICLFVNVAQSLQALPLFISLHFLYMHVTNKTLEILNIHSIVLGFDGTMIREVNESVPGCLCRGAGRR